MEQILVNEFRCNRNLIKSAKFFFYAAIFLESDLIFDELFDGLVFGFFIILLVSHCMIFKKLHICRVEGNMSDTRRFHLVKSVFFLFWNRQMGSAIDYFQISPIFVIMRSKRNVDKKTWLRFLISKLPLWFSWVLLIVLIMFAISKVCYSSLVLMIIEVKLTK